MAGGGTWTTPKTWTAAVVSVADMLTHVRDNLNALTQAATTITTTGTQTALALPVGRGDLVIYANNATALTVQGIAAGEDGQRLSIFSKGAGTIALNDQNASASAANRIITGASATVDLIAGSGRAELVYDLTTTRWRIAATVATAIVPISAAATVGTTLAVTGVTTVAAGSAAAPAVVSTTGTSDTGVFFPAADTVAYSTAGSERLRISSTGNVGIGTVSAGPATVLEVKGATSNFYPATNPTTSGTARAITIGEASNNSNYRLAFGYFTDGAYKGAIQATEGGVGSKLAINADGGNVGIGTASPTYQTQLSGSGQSVSAMTDAGNKGAALYVTDTNGAAGSGGAVLFGANATTPFAALKGLLTNGGGTTTGDLALSFRSSTASTALTERFFFQSTGLLGIGTSSVSYQLQLSTDSAGKPGAGGLWTVVSDERIKTDIVPADLDRCYEIVKSVPLKHFGFKPGVYTDEQIQDKHSLGWIAQDVQQVFAKAVSVKPFTLHTDIPDGTENYEEQDFTLDQVETTTTSIQIIDGKPVQVSKTETAENKVLLFDTVDVLDESGAVVMNGDTPLTYQMPRMVTKTRLKVRHETIEDCLDLNSGQMIAALYGCVQALMAKIEALEAR